MQSVVDVVPIVLFCVIIITSLAFFFVTSGISECMAFSMGLGTGVFMVIYVDSFVAHVDDITLSSLSASSSSCSFPQVSVSVSIIILVCYYQVEEASATLLACSTQCRSSIYLRDLLEDML